MRWSVAVVACLFTGIVGCSPGSGGSVGDKQAADASATATGRDGVLCAGASVLLVTLDTTRADRIGVYGHSSAETPVIDRLAGRGILFESAYSAAPVTLPSHTSILTGVYPTAHGVRDNALFQVAPEARLLSEVLQERGWRTAAFVGSLILEDRYGLAQGFSTYGQPGVGRVGTTTAIIQRRADAVVDQSLAWFAGLGPDEKFFAWVHFYDPHLDYDPPGRYAEMADPYDGEIAFCDRQLGRLLDGLEAGGQAKDLLVIIASDHGEALGEHGEQTHGIFLYRSTMRVPLIVVLPRDVPGRRPGAPPPGLRVSAPVSVTDIPATVLELLGLPAETMPAVHVPSLLAAVRDPETARERALYMESYLPYHSFRWHPLTGVIWNSMKLIVGRHSELYDLRVDPGETHDLVGEREGLVERMRRRLDALVARNPPLAWGVDHALDEAERDRMAALGYVGLAKGEDPNDPSLPDARDRIGDLQRRADAGALIVRGTQLLVSAQGQGSGAGSASEAQRARLRRQADELFDRARVILGEILRENPGDVLVYARIGSLETMRGHWEEAIPALERSLLAQPGFPTTHYNLAVCYQETGHPDWALRQMEKAITCEPAFLRGHRWIVQHYLDLHEFGKALWWLEHYRSVASESDVASAEVETWIRSTEDQMERSGQKRVAPEGFPAADRLPEGVAGRSAETPDGAGR